MQRAFWSKEWKNIKKFIKNYCSRENTFGHFQFSFHGPIVGSQDKWFQKLFRSQIWLNKIYLAFHISLKFSPSRIQKKSFLRHHKRIANRYEWESGPGPLPQPCAWGEVFAQINFAVRNEWARRKISTLMVRFCAISSHGRSEKRGINFQTIRIVRSHVINF